MSRRLCEQTRAGLLLCLMLLACPVSALNWEPAAIAGEDTDGDGIRDDVAGFIQQHWQADDLRHWAREAARASQAYLVSGGNRFALHRAHAFMERSRRCLSQTHGPQVANTVINRVLRIQLDSYERKQRYKEAVDQWVHKVSREDLPQQPDDNWNPSCGPADAPVPQRADIPAPQSSGDDSELPPPNFFITRAMPRETDKAPASSASVKVRPLPSVALPDSDSEASDVPQPAKGSWTTYSPRPRPQTTAATPASNSQLPVHKLGADGSTSVARRTAAPVISQRRRPATPGKQQLPAALRELAPFIEDVRSR